MSMKPQPIPEIPAETVRVVQAVFPKGNIYVHLHDMLGSIYQDELFEDLYPDRGQPAYAPWRLALVTIFQFMENLTDRQTDLSELRPQKSFPDDWDVYLPLIDL